MEANNIAIGIRACLRRADSLLWFCLSGEKVLIG